MYNSIVGRIASWGESITFSPSTDKITGDKVISMKTCNERHGMYETPEYNSWHNMKQRCYNKNHDHYKYYGNRGINICKRWQNSFIAFFNDMGLKPFPKAQIDRIDNDGNYEPNNCHWATAAKNAQNRSTNKLTMQKANIIRQLYKTGKITQTSLANIYGLTPAGVSETINNKRWI